MANRDQYVSRIVDEHTRQFNLPGVEYDVQNTPNDWSAIASSYCLRSITRLNVAPSASDYENDLIKAAAVILAALEHVEHMKNNGLFDTTQKTPI